MLKQIREPQYFITEVQKLNQGLTGKMAVIFFRFFWLVFWTSKKVIPILVLYSPNKIGIMPAYIAFAVIPIALPTMYRRYNKQFIENFNPKSVLHISKQ